MTTKAWAIKGPTTLITRSDWQTESAAWLEFAHGVPQEHLEKLGYSCVPVWITEEEPQQAEQVAVVDYAMSGITSNPDRKVRWLKDIPPAGTKLYAAPPQAPGMVAVPEEPTEEMLRVASECRFRTSYSHPYDQVNDANKAVWKAMLSARPQNGTAGGESQKKADMTLLQKGQTEYSSSSASLPDRLDAGRSNDKEGA